MPTAKEQALAATDTLIAELVAQLDDARAARRKLSGEPDLPNPDNPEAPKDKMEAIVRVLQLSSMDALGANAIFGALDAHGWLTDADRHDDKHFHKSLQKLFERGTLVKPKRGMYALRDKMPTYTFPDPALGNGAMDEGAEEAILEET